MPANYVLLERIELNASASSISFTNIPQSGYTDLKIVVSARCDAAYERRVVQLQFNGATTNYSDRYLQGYNGTAASGTNTGSTYIELRDIDGATATSNTFSNMEIYVPNYTSSNYKSVSTDGVTETNGALAMNAFTASLWSSTSAISSITLTPGNGSFVQYSTFSLYGLAAVGTTPVIAPKASGGNITTDGTYWIHTFNSTGAFVPSTTLSCDYLVVAGGGGGGNGLAAGGGGGGFRTATAQSLAAASYTVTVGAGGATNTSFISNGYSGSNSSIASFSATGGGGGGRIDQNGIAGGSGGGGGGSQGSGTTGGAGNAGSYSPVEGYAGGNGVNGGSPRHISGGGGGAGAVGSNATSTVGGNGGNGATNSYSGSSVTYAGGGGGAGRKANGYAGGTGGTGGGGSGAGSTLTTATAGTVNLGGGGGGGDFNDSGSDPTGAAGGSGVVIIRYLVA